MLDSLLHPELIRAVRNTIYRLNPAYVEGSSAPPVTADPYAPPRQLFHAVHVFLEIVSNLPDIDYGDFMRKVNNQICNLRKVFCSMVAPSALFEVLRDMQLYTQFAPSGEIESTRERLLMDSRDMISILRYLEGKKLEKRTTSRAEALPRAS